MTAHDPAYRPQGDDRVAAVVNPDPLDRHLAAAALVAPLGPTGKLKVREALVDYFLRMEANQAIWHYNQVRKYRSLGRAPEQGGEGDCSDYIIYGFWWAQHVTGLYLPDPSGNGYDGYGWSGSECDTNHARPVPNGRVYFPGDIGIYGSSCDGSHHAVVCTGKGYRATARWSSFGNERAPERWQLDWLPDLLGVYRTVRLT